MKRCPLKLVPVPREVIWGGTKLKDKYGKEAPFDRIAESWELSVRPEAVCRIDGGDFDGMFLSDYIASAGLDAVSPGWDGKHFPLLVKFIDAGDDLSVQVHPDAGYALSHGCEQGKTEVWYIAEAEPGAEIVYGLEEGISEDDFRRLVNESKTSEALRRLPVSAGESYFIPSGQVHALGRGVFVAEIQQNSDVTYRIDDYGRRQKDGTLRKLHTEQAKDVVRVRSDEYLNALRFSRPAGPHTIVACDAFRTDLLTPDDLPTAVYVTEESFLSLLCTDGSGNIFFESQVFSVRKGDSYFVPAGTGKIILAGDMTCLITTL